jgi:hypothetical protein
MRTSLKPQATALDRAKAMGLISELPEERLRSLKDDLMRLLEGVDPARGEPRTSR